MTRGTVFGTSRRADEQRTLAALERSYQTFLSELSDDRCERMPPQAAGALSGDLCALLVFQTWWAICFVHGHGEIFQYRREKRTNPWCDNRSNSGDVCHQFLTNQPAKDSATP
jgi:hypothetical protein